MNWFKGKDDIFSTDPGIHGRLACESLGYEGLATPMNIR
jgi:hypothetical protein